MSSQQAASSTIVYIRNPSVEVFPFSRTPLEPVTEPVYLCARGRDGLDGAGDGAEGGAAGAGVLELKTPSTGRVELGFEVA